MNAKHVSIGIFDNAMFKCERCGFWSSKYPCWFPRIYRWMRKRSHMCPTRDER